MGQAKQEWLESQDREPMYKWIEDNYGDDAGEEGSDDWDDAVQAYGNYCNEQNSRYDESLEQEEYQYYLHMTLGDADEKFRNDIIELKKLIEGSSDYFPNHTFCKMVYAHAVTIMEVYFESLIKSLILSSDAYLNNTIEKVEPFSNTKYKLSEISSIDGAVRKFVISKLSENLFHNIPKTVKILSGVLGSDIKINQKEVVDITKTRHHIVHRNGKDLGDEVIYFDSSKTLSAIGHIMSFAYELRCKI